MEAVQYCAVCFVKLDEKTGNVTMRPLVATGERTTIPLQARRVTMCKTHAAEAIEAKTHAAA